MKTISRAILFGFLIMAFGRVSAQSKNSQELVVPLSDPGKPVTLECHVISGSIHVIGYDGKDVVVTVYMDSTRREEEGDEPGGMKRIGAAGGMDIRADEHDNIVQINTGELNSKIAAITIKVPQNTARVDVGTVNGGDVNVSDVSGKIEIGNVNGAITAKGISGSVVANTVNGNVIVTFKSVDAQTAMAFSSLNGKIDVTLPADSKANLKMKSSNGEIFSDFDVAVDKTTPKVETRNEDHYHEIKIDGWVYGKINGGGPEIMMQSTFGKIYLRKAK
jgi:hypothetical protein